MKTHIEQLKAELSETPTFFKRTIEGRSYLVSTNLNVIVKLVEFKGRKFHTKEEKEQILAELRKAKKSYPEGYKTYFISNLIDLTSHQKRVEKEEQIYFICTKKEFNEQILKKLNPFFNKPKPDVKARLAYAVLGAAIATALWSFVPHKRIDMLEELAITQAKIFFLRGCTMYNTIEVCKKQEAFTDGEEIFNKIQNLEDASASLPVQTQKNFDWKTNNELQKIMEGRTQIFKI